MRCIVPQKRGCARSSFGRVALISVSSGLFTVDYEDRVVQLIGFMVIGQID